MKKIFALFVSILILTLCGCDFTSENPDICEDWVSCENVDISQSYEDLVDTWDSQIVELPKIPDRVSELNISEPEWLNYISSEQTDEWLDWYNSFRIQYSWDYDLVMDEAKKIADNAWITLNAEFQWAQNADSQFADLIWSVKWALYTNYSLSKNPDSQYMITISVEEDWLLEIEIVDWEKQNENDS
jgi:hypothetical protein